jgi:hypothetical protein
LLPEPLKEQWGPGKQRGQVRPTKRSVQGRKKQCEHEDIQQKELDWLAEALASSPQNQGGFRNDMIYL